MSKKSAAKASLFAAGERERNPGRKGDLLATLEGYVDLAAPWESSGNEYRYFS